MAIPSTNSFTALVGSVGWVTQGSETGKIFYRQHEWPPEEDLFFVANDFNSFLDSLFEYVEDDE